MVYCSKCGTKNSDDDKICTQCGAPLYTAGETGRESYDDACGGRRRTGEPYRRMENECFGIPRGGTIVGIAIGAIIVLAGIIWLLQQSNLIASSVNVWPLAAIIFGVLIIIGALYALSRRRYADLPFGCTRKTAAQTDSTIIPLRDHDPSHNPQDCQAYYEGVNEHVANELINPN